MLTFQDGCLTAANALIERRWRLHDGVLVATVLVDRASGRSWLAAEDGPGMVPPGGAPAGPWSATWTPAADDPLPVEAPSERGALTVTGAGGRGWRLQVQLFADCPAVTCRLSLVGEEDATATATATAAAAVSGIEGERPSPAADGGRDRCERLLLEAHHLDLVEVDLRDRSDACDNLAHMRRWRLSPVDKVAVRGCLAAVEDVLSGDGLALLRHAPLPPARPPQGDDDLVAEHRRLTLRGHGCGGTGEGWAWSLLAYRGGGWGRAAALHRLQRRLRAWDGERDGRFITNTWGDRNRDGRISEAFIGAEIAAAADLGADAVQIDDGWQRGVSANSLRAAQAGGVWSGFWAADPRFWDAHPERFPAGLGPVVAAARAAGIGIGLWFAPDSADEFARWRRDADAILALHRAHGVRLVKIDGVTAASRLAGDRLQALLQAVLRESGGAVSFDLDCTAEIRPGPFGPGSVEAGALFIENRYTDWHRWWPHATLRTLWQLAWHVPPQRLRMEFLNPARNQERYAGDPLAPMAWPWDYGFASVMAASPLGWFEASGLPPAMATALRPLVAAWRRWRGELHGGTILPIGECPDGTAWSGFCSLGGGHAHVLAYREHNRRPSCAFTLPPEAPRDVPLRRLGGRGEAAWEGGALRIAIPEARDWAWFRLG